MPNRGVQVLQHRRVSESRDPEATRAFMHLKEFYLELHPREARQFDFAASALYLPSSYIGYIQYGAETTVRVPASRTRDDYFIHLPLHGSSEVTNDKDTVVCDRRRGVISSPAGHVMHAQQGSSRLTVSLTKSAMMGHLAALLGYTPKLALEFNAAIDLNSAAGQRFNRHIRMAIADLDDPAPIHNPIMTSMYEQLIMTGLLLSQPNNYTNALHRRETRVAPRDVQRAVDHIQGHLNSPLTLRDIAVASGIPGRTLLKHFRDHWGTSPMRYTRIARLTRVHEALLHNEWTESVTDVAMAWGFLHLGRFSIEYRKHFGESPSETLHRTRTRSLTGYQHESASTV
jgi:AraC-like DNA-binding protein